MTAFHDIRFPTDISRGARGGPERRTEIVTLGSGREERNTRWADSRRTYAAGYGVKTQPQLYEVLSFFEERRGRLHAFRWKDHLDHTSGAPGSIVTPQDQEIATGDGETATFQLIKTYGSGLHPWVRMISKPVADSVRVAVDGLEQTEIAVNIANGEITFPANAIPTNGAVITAGYEFDVPVRFDADRLDITVEGFSHGAIPQIPVVEVRL